MNKGKVIKFRNSVLSIMLCFFISFSCILFSACTVSQEDRESIQKVIEIRDSLLNKGDIKSLGAFLSSDFPQKTEYLKQLNMQHFYLTDYAYRIRMIKPGEAESFGKKSVYRIEYNLTFKMPDDKAPLFFCLCSSIYFTKTRINAINCGKKFLGYRYAFAF